MTDESERKGFGGISSLVSDVEEEVSPEKPASSATKQKPPPRSEPEKVTGAHNERASTQTAAPKPKQPTPPRTADQMLPPPPKGSSAVKWFWSIVGIGILIALFNSGQDDRSDSSSRTTYSGSGAPSTPSPTSAAPSLEFIKPPIGTNQLLSVAQIRWCLREDMRIEAKRAYANNSWEIDKFNAMVADYNQRCGSFQYRVGTLERAQREVEGMRSQIVAEALARSSTPSTPSVGATPPSPSTGSQLLSRPQVSSGTASQSTTSQGGGRTALTYEVQTLLKQLGYNPGPVDGIYGGKTKSAIEQFERDIGRYPGGQVTQELRALLKQRAQRKNTSSKSMDGSKPSLSSIQASTSEMSAIENACSAKKVVHGPAAYNECISEKLVELSRVGKRPDFEGASKSERLAIENACSAKMAVHGPGAYYGCVEQKVGELRRVGQRPDFAGASTSERNAIENACSAKKAVHGPGAYYTCIEEKLGELRRVGKPPSFSGTTKGEQDSIENACSAKKAVHGPAAYYACLNEKLAALRRIERRPDLSTISSSQRRAIENVCSVKDSVYGPAAYYECIAGQLAAIR